MQTKQEIIDQVINGLIEQGQQAIEDDTCMYRSPTGLKCAIGMLISDEDYDSRMEGHGINELLGNSWLPENIIAIEETYPKLLRNLQSFHDSYNRKMGSFTKYLQSEKYQREYLLL